MAARTRPQREMRGAGSELGSATPRDGEECGTSSTRFQQVKQHVETTATHPEVFGDERFRAVVIGIQHSLAGGGCFAGRRTRNGRMRGGDGWVGGRAGAMN
jgi:hypothetical protein